MHSRAFLQYWNSPPYPNPVLAALSEAQGGTGNKTVGWWHQIKINGVSMHDAVMGWWNGTATSKQVHADCLYDARKSTSNQEVSTIALLFLRLIAYDYYRALRQLECTRCSTLAGQWHAASEPRQPHAVVH